MSSHRSVSSVISPSLDRDVTISTAGSSSATHTKGKDSLESSEKTKQSKRRFFELDEKHPEASSEVHPSSERSSKEKSVVDCNSEQERENQLSRNDLPNSSLATLPISPNTLPNTLSSLRTQLDTREYDSNGVTGDQDHNLRDFRNGSRRGGSNGNDQGTVSNGNTITLGQNGEPRPSAQRVISPVADSYPRSSTHQSQAQPPPSDSLHFTQRLSNIDGETRTTHPPNDTDAEMVDGDPLSLSTGNSRSQDRNDHDKERHVDGKTDESGITAAVPSKRSPRRSTRVAAASRESQGEAIKTRGSLKRRHSPAPTMPRKIRSGSAALATAVAAAQAEAQVQAPLRRDTLATASLLTPSTSKSSASFPNTQDVEMADGAAQVRSSATVSTVSDLNIDPALGSAGSGSPKGSSAQSTPMENIVKVAEAAIAAQNAANASKTSTNLPVSSRTTSSTSSPPQSVAAAASSSSSSPTPSTSYNPYMVTTQMVSGKPSVNTMSLPTSPGIAPLSMNPYAMYYSPINTPVTPGASSPYPYPYANPYFYLTGPMASPSSMYPTSPNVATPGSAQRPTSEVQRPAKPKRLKAHTVTSKSFSIPMVPRDKRGKPMLPLNVGIMTVINMGEVCTREHFHTERYIFPVGYEVSRRYLSTINPNIEVVYHCTILDGGDGPKFQIISSDVPDHPIIAGTATGAWSTVVKQANNIRNRQHSNSVSGPDFFGLGQNTIKHLIQELPNADRLKDYVWQTFIEGGPLGGRHAAVIPALPEEYDASTPVGAYYPTDRDKQRRSLADPPAQSPPKGLSHYPQHIIAQAEAQRVKQQALHQAQQVGTQPLQLGESSGQGQVKATYPAATASSTMESGALPIAIPQQPTNFADDRPHPGGIGHMNGQALQSGDASLTTGNGSAVPATFASIMNTYSTVGGTSNVQVAEQRTT